MFRKKSHFQLQGKKIHQINWEKIYAHIHTQYQGWHTQLEIKFPDNSLTKFENSLTCCIAIFGLSIITLDILRKFKIYNVSLKGDFGLHPPPLANLTTFILILNVYSIAIIIFLFFVFLLEEKWIWCIILIIQIKPVSFLQSYQCFSLDIFYCMYKHTNELGQNLIGDYRVPFLCNNRKKNTQTTKLNQHYYKKYLVNTEGEREREREGEGGLFWKSFVQLFTLLYIQLNFQKDFFVLLKSKEIINVE